MRKAKALYKNNKSFLGGASASLADQVILSLLNLAVGMIFIKYSTKQDYAAYSQVYALVYLTSSVQSALINSPAITLLPQEATENRARLAGSFFVLQAGLSILFAALLGIMMYWLPKALSFDGTTALLAVAFALTIWVVWLRDFLRNQLFLGLKAIECFKLDLIYVLLCAIALYGLIAVNLVLASTILLGIAISAIISTLPWLFKSNITFHFQKQEIKNTFNNAWNLAKWSLPGGLVSWAFGNGYVLIAAYTIGSEGTAEIVAARLFVAPLGMIYLAWSNIFRPRASHWIAEGRINTIKRASYASLAAIACGVVIYSAILVLAYPYLESHVLGQKYNGLTKDIIFWAGFFLASGFASIGTGVLLALGRYKETFYAAVVGCLISVPLMFALGASLNKAGILLGLTIGELATASWLMVAMMSGLSQRAEIGKLA